MLTDLQKRFCDIYIQQGGVNAAECARLAGYADTSDAAKVRAAALLRNENVLAELRRLAQCRISAAVASAAANLEDIANDPRSKDRSVQLKAVQAILDRGGLLVERLSRLDIHHHVQVDALPPGESLARDMLSEMGAMGLTFIDDGTRFREYCASLDRIAAQPERLALPRKDVVDVDYVDVEPSN